jgi:hypothetical protein
MKRSPWHLRTLLITFSAVACSPRQDPLATARSQPPESSTCASDLRTGTGAVRAALDRQYARNQAAFRMENLDSVMVLRSDSFSTVGPDGQARDRAQMAEYTTGLFNAVTRWIELEIEIDSIALDGMLARAETRQHLERMALRPDGQVHHVETWVAQRETWLCDGGGWKLHYVDQVRDQRRMVDSVPG